MVVPLSLPLVELNLIPLSMFYITYLKSGVLMQRTISLSVGIQSNQIHGSTCLLQEDRVCVLGSKKLRWKLHTLLHGCCKNFRELRAAMIGNGEDKCGLLLKTHIVAWSRSHQHEEYHTWEHW
jgi:hypothetical protein